MPLHCPKEKKRKEKQNPYKIRKIKEKKRKLLVSKASHNRDQIIIVRCQDNKRDIRTLLVTINSKRIDFRFEGKTF